MAVSNSSCGSADVSTTKHCALCWTKLGGGSAECTAKRDAAATSDPEIQELKKLTSDRSSHGGVIASECVRRGGGEDGRAGP